MYNLDFSLSTVAHKRTASIQPKNSAVARYSAADLSTLFQDAAMTIPVLADGDPVGAVMDVSGNGFHLTQNTASKKPTYKTDGTHYWLDFDGINHVMVAHLTVQPSLAICYAGMVTGVEASNSAIFSMTGAATNFYLRARSTTQFKASTASSGIGVSNQPATSSTIDYLGEAHVFSKKLDPQTSRFTSRVDGSEIWQSSNYNAALDTAMTFRLMVNVYADKNMAGRFYGAVLTHDLSTLAAEEHALMALLG
jgi:hypothetical protein